MANIGLLPAPPYPNRVTMREYAPTYRSQAHNLRIIRRSVGAHRFEFTIEYPPLKRDMFGELIGFLSAARGGLNEFDAKLHPYSYARGKAAGESPTMFSAALKGSTTILTQNWTPNVTGVLLPGDVIRFAGHSKVYMVRQQANSDSNGQSAIIISQPLIADVQANESITVDAVPFTLILPDDAIEGQVVPGGFYNFKFSAVEGGF